MHYAVVASMIYSSEPVPATDETMVNPVTEYVGIASALLSFTKLALVSVVLLGDYGRVCDRWIFDSFFYNK